MSTTQQKWTSTAGPRQTKAVNDAMKAVSWHGKSAVRITNAYDGRECRMSFTSPFSPVRPEVAEAMAAVGDKFAWTVTRDNHKAVIEEFCKIIDDHPMPEIDERETPEELAAEQRRRDEAEAERQATATQHAIEVGKIVSELRAKYPWAKPAVSTLSRQAQAAANIRAELARAFPGVKFSVTSESFSMGNAVNVRWDLGPTTREVDSLLAKYRYGDFDGMTDSYNHDHSAYGDAVEEVLGRAKYVHSHRDCPDDVMATLSQQFGRYAGATVAASWDRITVHGDNEQVSTHVNRALSRTSFPAGAVPTGIEFHDPADEIGYFRVTYTVPAAPAGWDKVEGDKAGAKFHVEKHYHTKRECDFWLVVLDVRLADEEFEAQRRRAKACGGWYSRKWGKTPCGFGFDSEAEAQAFGSGL